jgi:hypothetical protein
MRQFHRLPVLLLIAICSLPGFTACGHAAGSASSATLRIGEAIQFSSGKITKLAAEGDMVFRYTPPQSPHGWRYNPTTGQIEYQAQAGTTGNYPLLSASKTAAFKTKPDIAKLTSGDINAWTEDEYDVGPGRYIVVRGYNDKQHWLVKITSLTAASNDPKTWKIGFTYEPIKIATGSAGTAGSNMPVTGILSFRERLHSEKIITLDLSNGVVKEMFDGYGVSQNAKGEFAYVNPAQQIIIADKTGKQVTVFDHPHSEAPEITIGGSGMMAAILSPSGKYIAVGGVSRRKSLSSGGITMPGATGSSVVIVDRSGKEIKSYVAATNPTWSSTGRLLTSNLDEPGIFITDASLGNPSKIPNVPAGHIDGIAVSPDEKTIAFSVNYRIWLMNMDGTGLKQLTQSGLNEVTPVFSPDGKYLAFQQNFKNKKEFYQIVIIRLGDGKILYVADQQGVNREPSGIINWVMN